MYLGESNIRTIVPRVVYDHPVRTDKFIRCSGKVFSLLNRDLRCGLEKGHDGRHKKILEPKKRWESILPPLPEGQGTDSGYIIHGVACPQCPKCGKAMFNDNRGCVCGYDPLAPETKNGDSSKGVRKVTLSWVTSEGNSNTAEYHEGDKIELGTYKDGVQVTVYVENIG